MVGEARDGVEAVELAGRLAVDVVLMDIRMPRRDSLAATELLLRAPSPPAVLVLTTFDTDDSVLTALRLGRAASCSRTPRPTGSSTRCAGSRRASRRSPPP
ncbi:MAG: Two-component transcriptional response regulator, LuxR family [uncultured Friedmanniella sp.]|uniref:Two-component transcriptional response regulator, LuxR family n=1 Tax=uncultured Friedmanniella sp. TaxID=335381 RepID=A0A6J4JX35_9ACTN|nr:MAG: Two-component transcriptional response regulator, LuxR family [uncultured Friedmanniella sp.]